MRIEHQPLRALATAILARTGATDADAKAVADHLVEANLKGHDSHGVGMIPTYVWAARQGVLQPDKHARIVSDTGPVLVVDGQAGFGQVVAMEATLWGIARAKSHGICAVSLQNASHIGRVGAYAERCVAEELVSTHYTNVVGHPAQVAPFWSAEARLNTNPFTCGIPVSGGEPVVLDMATSTVALGKVRVAQAGGAPLPKGALVDAQGQPTTDPAALFPAQPDAPRGALTAFGLHKGSGLALICELLGGALAGKWTLATETEGVRIINNMLMIILDPTAFGDLQGFQREVRGTVERIHSSRPKQGVDQVLVPGDPERRAYAQRLEQGLEIEDATYEALVQTANKQGLTSEEVAALVGEAPA